MCRAFYVAFVCLIGVAACKPQDDSLKTSSATESSRKAPKFESLSAAVTGVDFNNLLDINVLKSPLDYINVYNGGGVAVGDLNNDGLPELFFTGNLTGNKLYLNKGGFSFEDITDKAGVGSSDGWSTGVTMADVNNDGLLDMYVCRAYYEDPAKRENLLYINKGDLTFSEEARKFGLNDPGYSISAVFFDYNKDGRADLFVGNHPLNRFVSFADHIKNWNNPIPAWSSKLFRNDGNDKFTEVTKESGFLSYGWTLGAIAADLNQDSWPDLYVAVDHTEPDRYYLNNGNGTFTEVSDQKLRHVSHSSMGVDAADINNDGLLDMAVVEMLATNNFNEKTKMASMNIQRFWSFVEVGYQYQYMRNMLHLNVGNGEFSEIGQMAGVHRTNWSWASLLADFDNDGWKDLYVTNGYLREYLDKDHMKKYMASMDNPEQQSGGMDILKEEFGKKAPINKVENNFFLNNGDLTFSERGPESGLNFLGFSSGAAYADLDNDGDLDLVVNNTNDPASIYKNLDRENGGHNYLSVSFQYPNTVCPIGSKVTIETESGQQFQEFAYTRGYQGSVEGILHFGLGANHKVLQLKVDWLDGKQQMIQNIEANQEIVLKYTEAVDQKNTASSPHLVLFDEVTAGSGIDFKHNEVIFDDYKVQVLIPHKMSQCGPFISTGDINKDGKEDFYIGGAKGQSGALYIQTVDGQFQKAAIPAFTADLQCEDMGSVMFDANNDGLLDLYVVSGSNEFKPESNLYQDRLYINTGNGVLQKVKNALPAMLSSGSCVKPFDFDQDGDLDLFVGGRQVPGQYPSPATSTLLENNKGFFKDVTESKAPALKNLGMVTDMLWTDVDQDGKVDLVIVGEWMPVTIFKQQDGKFANVTTEFKLEQSVGWWNRIVKGDIDKDGDDDFIVGNLGYNYKYRATPERPFHVYAADFDDNATFDIALGYFLEGDVLYPVRGRQCSSEQCPEIAEKFHKYEDFGKASIFEVYGDRLKDALHYEAKNFATCALINQGGKFEFIPLPNEAQIAPTNGIVLKDFDKDGNLDLLLGGNLFVSEVETGRADAGRGMYLKGKGNGSFSAAAFTNSGLRLTGDLKDIAAIKIGDHHQYIVSNNNGNTQLIRLNGVDQKVIQ